jgi:hypothetical protein
MASNSSQSLSPLHLSNLEAWAPSGGRVASIYGILTADWGLRSILAKAFRGELVPQDSNDEPAVALLERIRAERERTSNPKQRGKTTRKNSSKQLSINLE